MLKNSGYNIGKENFHGRYMQKNNIEDLKTADNLTKEESFGGFQYKHNYDEYKKELTEKRDGKSGALFRVLIIAGFALLLIFLGFFITDTVLKTKGSSLYELFRSDAPASTIPHKTVLDDAQINGTASKYTVRISADGKDGAGIILTEDGYIVTTFGLAGKAEKLTVNVNGGSYDAALAGVNEENDTAVLKISLSGLTAAELGCSHTLEPGQEVFCKSGESELKELVIVDASDDLYIKTEPKCDIPGAPLINSYGQVVGMISGGEGHALHTDALLTVIKKLLSDSSSITVSKSPLYISALGIYVEQVSEKQSEIYKIPTGFFVTSVHSPNRFSKGDIIVSVDGKDVSDAEMLVRAASSGVSVKVYRNNAYVEFTLK